MDQPKRSGGRIKEQEKGGDIFEIRACETTQECTKREISQLSENKNVKGKNRERNPGKGKQNLSVLSCLDEEVMVQSHLTTAEPCLVKHQITTLCTNQGERL